MENMYIVRKYLNMCLNLYYIECMNKMYYRFYVNSIQNIVYIIILQIYIKYF